MVDQLEVALQARMQAYLCLGSICAAIHMYYHASTLLCKQLQASGLPGLPAGIEKYNPGQFSLFLQENATAQPCIPTQNAN